MPELSEQLCCDLCASILDTVFPISLSDISQTCEICRLLRHAASKYEKDTSDLCLIRKGSWLCIAPVGPRIVQLYSFPGTQTLKDTQIGLPIPLRSEEPAYTKLLKTWLDSCDTHEKCNPQSDSSQTALPTRLINVGTLESPKLQLYITKKGVSYKYVALSYCWGELSTNDKAKFCTAENNYVARQQGFDESDLPQTHRDAIWICRSLGIEYLWIDSHCIIQLGDNGVDWKREAPLMENVYSSAYCVFAVSSATSVHAGFLGRESKPESEPESEPERELRCIYAQDHLGRRFYISTNVEDFDQHVEEGPLNKRAWVLQERYLARRTLHFAADQVYWECGEEIYCGNLAQLSRPKFGRALASDPYFPSELVTSGTLQTWHFIQSLLKDYSQRKLGNPNDRQYAVSGLEGRIAHVLKCGSSYGVFEKYLHRNLLWYLAPRNSTRTECVSTNHDIPSWTWMAHRGGIEFVEIPFGKVDRIKHDPLQFNEERNSVVAASLGEITNCTTRRCENCTARICERRHVLEDAGGETGWVQYDLGADEEPNTIQCVVIGSGRAIKRDPDYYILLVRLVGSTSAEDQCKRVGVGQVQSGCVTRQRKSIVLV